MSEPNIQDIPIADIITDAGTQIRELFNPDTAARYANALREGKELPPAIVFRDRKSSNWKKHWLADGFYRLGAHRLLKRKIMRCDIRDGNARDAILYACGANEEHGERRSLGDKRRAVLTLLKDEEWSMLPNTQIANYCHCDEGYVRKLKKELRSSQVDHSDCPSPLEMQEVARNDADCELEGPADLVAAFAAMPEEKKRELRALAEVDAADDAVSALEALLGRCRLLHPRLPKQLQARLDEDNARYLASASNARWLAGRG